MSAPEQHPERRKSRREKTSRQVFFRSTRDSFPLQNGTAVDISKDGLQVRAGMQIPVGTALEVEVFTPEGVDSILLRGEVARATPLGNGEFALGIVVRTMPAALSWIPSTPYAEREIGAPALRVTTHDSRQVLWQGSVAAADTQALVAGAAENSSGKQFALSTRWKRRLAAALLVALLLLLAWYAPTIWRALNDTALLVGGKRNATPDIEMPPITTQYFDAGANVTRGAMSDVEHRKLAEYLSALPMPPLPIPFEAAWNRAQPGNGGDAPASGYAPSFVGIGIPAEQERDPAQASPQQEVSSELPDEDPGFGTGGPETDSAEVAEGLTRDDVRASALAMMQTSNVPPAPDAIRIEVDKAAYTLTVFRGDAPLRTVPIGIGADDTTPTGTFIIANKLTDPYWYNRGESVAPGDPNNPLGHRWMGLNNGKGLTGYGLHGTEESDAIGQALSRGCVRLRPQDAESLFRLCPIGTQVIIK